jgi:hypothetical protein
MDSPGAQDDESLLKEEERNARRPMYDQTKLDGISQLWGLPPEDPDDLPGPEIAVEDVSFDGSAISQLWGRTPESPSADERYARNVVEEESFDGISELWGDTIDDDSGGDRESGASDEAIHGTTEKWQQENLGYSEENDEDYDLAANYENSGLSWYEDGSGDRLSQVLADEVWDDEVVEQEAEVDRNREAPITSLEEYEKKVVELSNEIKETEAILNAPPGADSTERDEEEETDFVGSNKTDATNEWMEEDDLDALGMDLSPADVQPTNTSTTNVANVTTSDPEAASEDILTNRTQVDEASCVSNNSTATISKDSYIEESANGDDDDANGNNDAEQDWSEENSTNKS